MAYVGHKTLLINNIMNLTNINQTPKPPLNSRHTVDVSRWARSSSDSKIPFRLDTNRESNFQTESTFLPEMYALPNYLEQRMKTLILAPWDDFRVFLQTDIVNYVRKQIPDITEKFICQFISTISFIYHLMRARNFTDYCVAVTSFVTSFGTISKYITEIVESFTHTTWFYFKTAFNFIATEASYSDTISNMQRNMDKLLRSEFVVAFKSLILSLVSVRFFNKKQSMQISKIIGPSKECSMLDLLQTSFETMSLAARMYECVEKGEEINKFFIASDPISSIITAAKELLAYQECLYTGLPTPGFMDQKEYMTKLVDYIQVTTDLMKNMKSTNPDYRNLSHIHIQMIQSRNTINSQMSGNSRQAPFGIILSGDPGIGKSVILPYLCKIHSEVKGRVFEESQIYARPTASEYMEGYLPFSHPYIHYSELGSKHQSLVEKSGDDVVIELTSMCDRLAFPCNMAFGDKGKIYALPELVVVDTNNAEMNIPLLVNNPAAYFRRFLFIEPIVKQQFRKEGSVSLDTQKSFNAMCDEENPIPLMDRWVFKVHTRKASNCKSFTKVMLMDGDDEDDIYALTELLKKLYLEHILQEMKVEQSVSSDNVSYLRPEQLGELDYHRRTTEQKILGTTMEQFQSESLFRTAFEAVDAQTRRLFVSLRDRVLTVPEVEDRSIEPAVYILEALDIPLSVEKIEAVRDKTSLWNCCTREEYFKLQKFFLMAKYDDMKISMSSFNTFAFSFMNFFLFIFSLVLLTIIPSSFTKGVIKQTLKYKTGHSQKRMSYCWSQFLHTLGWAEKPTYVMKNYNIAIFGFGAVTISTVLYYLFRARKLTLESSDFQCDSQYNNILNERENISGCKVPKTRVSSDKRTLWNSVLPCVFPKTQNVPSDIHRKIMSNVRLIAIVGKEGETKGHALGVCNNFIIFNKHFLGSIDDTTKWLISVQHVSPSHKESGHVRLTNFYLENLVHLADDVVMLAINGTIFKDITEYFVDAYVPNPIGINGHIGHDSIRAIKTSETISVIDKVVGNIDIRNPFQYQWSSHSSGQCGLPLILEHLKGCAIVGIHSAGDLRSSISFAAPVSSKEVLYAVKELKMKLHMSVPHSEGELDMDLVDPAPKSPFNFEDFNGVDYYGADKNKRVMIKKTSNVVESPLSCLVTSIIGQDLVDDNGEQLFGAPLMTPVVRGGEYISPYNITLRKLSNIKKPLDPRIMKKTINILVSHFMSGLRNAGVESLSPINLENAINGANNDCYLRSMDMSTSAGLTFGGKKYQHAEKISTELFPDGYEITDQVKGKLLEIFESYEKGETVRYLYGAQLKDEVRSMAKVKDGKTRIFYGGPFEKVILDRMYLIPFYTLMHQFKDIFCDGVTLNMHQEATSFVHYLTDFSDQIMEGDYGSYDTAMPFEIGVAANEIVLSCLESLGYEPHALNICKGLLTDNLFPTVQMLGDVFCVPGLQPSGKYATAEDNSLRGIILLVYAYVSMTGDGSDFFNKLKPIVYGDDLLVAVKPEVSFFNNNSYQEFCQSVYGIDYTNAQKTLEMKDFLNIHEVSFLKRTFVYREDLNSWVAPLDILSICKSIKFYMPSKTVNENLQLVSTLQSSLCELFFHYSEGQYEEIREKFVYATNLILRIPTSELYKALPTFRDHKIRLDLDSSLGN